MCDAHPEDQEHLFLRCNFVMEIRSKVMARFRYDLPAMNLSEEVLRLARIARKRGQMAQCYVAVWTEMVYEVWRLRCIKLYAGGTLDVNQAVRNVLFRVASKFQGHVSRFFSLLKHL